MSLIASVKELASQVECLARDASKQQHTYFALVDGIVRLQQELRVAKNFEVSDALREILRSAGIQVMQGTAGLRHEEIPAALKGRPVGDCWTEDRPPMHVRLSAKARQ